MKKLIFFVLFLILCSIGVYAYFYWKATQVKTPIVSIEVIVPEKKALKKVSDSNLIIPSKNIDPISIPISSDPLNMIEEDMPVIRPVENTPSLKKTPTEQVEEIKTEVLPASEKKQTKQIEEIKTEIISRDTSSYTEENTEVQEIVSENKIRESEPVVVPDALPNSIPLLIPTTEPIVKENVPVVSQ